MISNNSLAFLNNVLYVCTMLKGNKYRIYPTDEQKVLLEKHFGCVRKVYNMGLEIRNSAYRSVQKDISCNEISGELKHLKKEFPFFAEVNSQSLQTSLMNLDAAFERFFKKQGGYPNFKSKYNRQSFTCPQNGFLEDGKLSLPKFREGIRILVHRQFKGDTKSITVSKTPTMKYFVSILTDNKKEPPNKKIIAESTAVGIDLGIKSLIACSDGKKRDNPQYLRTNLVRLKWMQRQFSRKKKGSCRHKIWRYRVARKHEKIANQRKDFLHKESYAITKRYDTICMETLKKTNMLKNHKLALSISDVGWGMFEQFVKYKCEWTGGNVLQIGTFEPSTIECNNCGYINRELTLAHREWDCPNCGMHHDRDVNAAKVVKRKGLRDAVRSFEDVEVSALPAWQHAGNRADDASKILNNSLLIFAN